MAQIRIAENDYTIPNTKLVIRKGMNVSIPTYCIHHDADYYPDPEKFDPERFSDENKQKRHPLAFTAFGAGPRVCIVS
jgi:cytochrome P450 family 6